MAAHLSSMRERKPRGMMTHLSKAACEWFLIFMLFVDVVFSYLLQEFAKYCELQIPCPLCTRLDFGGKCSRSSVCSSHKEEISSMVLCSLNSNLADAHGLCGECLNPTAMQGDFECSSKSCCKETWIVPTSDDESLLDNKPVGLSLGGYKANVEPPLLDVPGSRRFSRQDGVKKLRNKLRASMRYRATENNDGEENSSLICERDIELGRRDHHLGMPVNDVLDSDEVKNVYGSSSDALIERASREHRLAESHREAVSLDSIHIHSVPSASTTLRVTKKSIYIEESCATVNRSAAMNIEAIAGSSSDESTYSSNSYIKNTTGSSCPCARTKSMSRVSASESGLLPCNEHEGSQKDESLDGVSVGDHDRSCKKSLYEELEEERKAASIAASQAMAMITRLQAEKAAVEMEAVQCIQMMELEAEHDMESLERANNLLSAKEKELHDLQNELEFYRNSFCVGSGLEDLHEETRTENSPGASSDSESARFSKENDEVSKFGDEKLYISHSLKKLVKNLCKDYCSDNVHDSPNGLILYEIKDVVAPIDDFLPNADRHIVEL